MVNLVLPKQDSYGVILWGDHPFYKTLSNSRTNTPGMEISFKKREEKKAVSVSFCLVLGSFQLSTPPPLC